jgi:arsenite/tail-anchored protein-transporting ATPase
MMPVLGSVCSPAFANTLLDRFGIRMTDTSPSLRLNLMARPVRNLFFTGKGGVGKTSLACAVALSLSDAGKSVLLVSTDPASNLDEMLGVPLGDRPTPVPGAAGLAAMNIDPNAAAESYRTRVIAQMGPSATETERQTVREQLSGACTTEIAAFDEFVGLLADQAPQYDHVVFDTAPTGHTLRLLSLPKAWTGFLKDNDRGASCLGPHSGLKMQEGRFQAALRALAKPDLTTIVLVTRPDKAALSEAARTSNELRELGLANQRLVVNGVFKASDASDRIATRSSRCSVPRVASCTGSVPWPPPARASRLLRPQPCLLRCRAPHAGHGYATSRRARRGLR